jgi:hypothetical protein
VSKIKERSELNKELFKYIKEYIKELDKGFDSIGSSSKPSNLNEHEINMVRLKCHHIGYVDISLIVDKLETDYDIKRK